MDIQTLTNPIGALTSYTPTVASSGGTITTSSATGIYVKLGPKLCWFTAIATITTNGTGSGQVRIGTPFTISTSNGFAAGGEGSVSGKAVQGYMVAGEAFVRCLFYDGTYPGANGANFTISGIFRYAA